MTTPTPASPAHRAPRGGHLRRWGVAYLLTLLFVASWVGQLLAQLPLVVDPAEHGWAEFWAATFENWQSEFLQLTVQAIVVVALARQVFRASLDDHDRLEAKVDELLRASRRDRDGDR